MNALRKWFYGIKMKLIGWEEINAETLADKITDGVNTGHIAGIKIRADWWGRTWCFTTRI